MHESSLNTLTLCRDRLEQENPARRGFGSAVVGILAIFLVAGASVAGNETGEVAPTWDEARVFLPGSAVPLKPANVPARDRPLPTVLYLTGCTGFDYSHDGTMGGWAQTLTAAGYAVVMPTSFAREYRPHNCDQATYTAGLAMEVMDMRLEEIEYALPGCVLCHGSIRGIYSSWVTAKAASLLPGGVGESSMDISSPGGRVRLPPVHHSTACRLRLRHQCSPSHSKATRGFGALTRDPARANSARGKMPDK